MNIFCDVICLQQIANAAYMLHSSSFAANSITLSFPIQSLPDLVWLQKPNNARVGAKILKQRFLQKCCNATDAFHFVMCLQQIANAANMPHFSLFAAKGITLSFPIKSLPNFVGFQKLNNGRLGTEVLEWRLLQNTAVLLI